MGACHPIMNDANKFPRYTRSSNPTKSRKSQVLDTKHDVSYEHTKSVRASDEGIYEVVSIRDKYCSFSTQKPQKNSRGSG